jgi:hypothetical protein
MFRPNMRLIDRYGTRGGDWYLAPNDRAGIKRALADLAEIRAESPSADWRLQTRGTETTWHNWED